MVVAPHQALKPITQSPVNAVKDVVSHLHQSLVDRNTPRARHHRSDAQAPGSSDGTAGGAETRNQAPAPLPAQDLPLIDDPLAPLRLLISYAHAVRRDDLLTDAECDAIEAAQAEMVDLAVAHLVAKYPAR
jgi:hypothetical protein